MAVEATAQHKVTVDLSTVETVAAALVVLAMEHVFCGGEGRG